MLDSHGGPSESFFIMNNQSLLDGVGRKHGMSNLKGCQHTDAKVTGSNARSLCARQANVASKISRAGRSMWKATPVSYCQNAELFNDRIR